MHSISIIIFVSIVVAIYGLIIFVKKFPEAIFNTSFNNVFNPLVIFFDEFIHRF